MDLKIEGELAFKLMVLGVSMYLVATRHMEWAIGIIMVSTAIMGIFPTKKQ